MQNNILKKLESIKIFIAKSDNILNLFTVLYFNKWQIFLNVFMFQHKLQAKLNKSANIYSLSLALDCNFKKKDPVE